MAVKLWQIGKANLEIERLETELAKVTRERDEAFAAVSGNNSEAAAAATQLQTELSASKETVALQLSEITNLKASLATQTGEIAALKEAAAKQAAEVPVQIARQVQTIQAQIGAPPIPSVPAEAKKGSEVKGINRMIASVKAELDQNFPLPRIN